MSAVISIQGLNKIYAGRKVIRNLDLEIQQEEIFGFLGPNGSGKTTTILMLLGLTKPDSGTVRVMEMDAARDSLEIKKHVGYLPEHVGFYPDLTARQNLRYIAELNDLRGREADERIGKALSQVGLEGEEHKKVQGYSRGMQQRLGIAEILLKDPGLVILDEPTLGLDPEGIRGMTELIKQLRDEQGLSVLLSSHLLYQVQQICDRVGILNQGMLVACGSIDGLINQKTEQGGQLSSLEDIYIHYFYAAPASRSI